MSMNKQNHCKYSRSDIVSMLNGRNITLKSDEYKNTQHSCAWQCGVCGKEWTSNACNVAIRRTGCPDCSQIAKNKRAMLPAGTIAIAAQNVGARFLEFVGEYNGNTTRCKLECVTCGNVWYPSTAAIVKKRPTGCPECARRNTSIRRRKNLDDLALFLVEHNHETLIRSWYEYRARGGSELYVDLLCPRCLHSFSSTWSNIKKGQGCSHCKHKGEHRAFIALCNKFGKDNVGRHVMLKPHKRFADFVIGIGSKKIWVEYDGVQHFKPVKQFGGAATFKLQVEKDSKDPVIAESLGLMLFRIGYNEDVPSAINKIAATVA